MTTKKIVCETLQFLLKTAMAGKTTSFMEIAAAVDYTELQVPEQSSAQRNAISDVLTYLQEWCDTRKMPRLTSLVVRQSGTDEGLPGIKFWKLMGFENLSLAARKEIARTLHDECFNYFKIPTELELA